MSESDLAYRLGEAVGGFSQMQRMASLPQFAGELCLFTIATEAQTFLQRLLSDLQRVDQEELQDLSERLRLIQRKVGIEPSSATENVRRFHPDDAVNSERLEPTTEELQKAVYRVIEDLLGSAVVD